MLKAIHCFEHFRLENSFDYLGLNDTTTETAQRLPLYNLAIFNNIARFNK